MLYSKGVLQASSPAEAINFLKLLLHDTEIQNGLQRTLVMVHQRRIRRETLIHAIEPSPGYQPVEHNSDTEESPFRRRRDITPEAGASRASTVTPASVRQTQSSAHFSGQPRASAASNSPPQAKVIGLTDWFSPVSLDNATAHISTGELGDPASREKLAQSFQQNMVMTALQQCLRKFDYSSAVHMFGSLIYRHSAEVRVQ